MIEGAFHRSNLLRFLLSSGTASISMALFNFAICYLRTFVFPFTPTLWWGDQVGFMDDGSRMVMGQLPYRDYFQIVPPGTDLAYAFLIKCFGLQIWIPNLLMAFLAAATALLMTMIASRLMRGPAILLPSLLLAGYVLPSSTDATHHWFSTVAILGAVLALMDRFTMTRVLTAGALCGLATCFTQTKGTLAVLGFIIYLGSSISRQSAHWRERVKVCLLFCAAAIAIFSSVNVYFLRSSGFGNWVFCLLIYPLRYYSSPSINNLRVLMYDFRSHAGGVSWISFPFLYATIPLVYIAFFARFRQMTIAASDRRYDRKTLLVAISGIAMFLAIASSPSAKRLGAVSPPALILLTWFFKRHEQRDAYFKLILGGGAIALATALAVRTQLKQHLYLDVPAGRLAFSDRAVYDEYRWIGTSTQPGQFFFGLAPLYEAFHLKNPAPIEGIHPSEYTRPEQVSALVIALQNHAVPLVIIRESLNLLYMQQSPSDHLQPFRAYLRQNYRLTKTFPSGDDVWEKIDAPNPLAGQPE
jgi:hypothetical protein